MTLVHAALAALVLAATPGTLEVYRSRAELPAWLASRLPADFDFNHSMVAVYGPPPAGEFSVRVIEPRRGELQTTRDGLLLALPSQCPPCRGARLKPPPPIPPCSMRGSANEDPSESPTGPCWLADGGILGGHPERRPAPVVKVWRLRRTKAPVFGTFPACGPCLAP